MAKKLIDDLKFMNGEVTLKLTLIGYKDGEYFVLYSPTLDLYAYGENEDEAFQAFEETVELYLDHVIKENTLESDLKKLGWRKHSHFKKTFDPPKFDPGEIMAKKGVNSFNVIEKQLALHA